VRKIKSQGRRCSETRRRNDIDTKEDELRVFIQLGLTMRQTQVYLASTQLGNATAAAIAKDVQADRAEIYRQ